jgi:miniconductance mechanosensitive channel
MAEETVIIEQFSPPADQPSSSLLQTYPTEYDNLAHYLEGVMQQNGVSVDVSVWISRCTGILLILLLALIANWVAKRLILRAAERFVEHSKQNWLRVLQGQHFFRKLSHLAPAWIIWTLTPEVLPNAIGFIEVCITLYLLLIGWLLIDALLNTLSILSDNNEKSQGIPIKGFTQAIKLTLFLVACVLALSVLFGKSPVFFLSGLGALTAVFLLVFKDALLGLVAGVMISVNQMVRIGDWIEMPGAGADGHVIDVSLTTVKVRNWDKTITTIPSYDLISKSFKNWRGMFDSGGRRIKRAIYLDMRSIHFLNEEQIRRMMRIRRLKDYLSRKVAEVQKSNQAFGDDLEALCNGRRLTNIGTFRAYCEAYLREHSLIHKDMILLVRQLAPTEHGLPLEIYAFTTDTSWVAHESIQADIFDHLLSVLSEFDLRVFQQPSGSDVLALGQRFSS